MRKAIGVVIVLYAVSHLMQPAFISFEQAMIATFKTIEVAAAVSQNRMNQQSR